MNTEARQVLAELELHDHKLASAVLDDVVAEYDLRFEDDAR